MPLADYDFELITYNFGTLSFGNQGDTSPGIDIVSIAGLYDTTVIDDDRESRIHGDFPHYMRSAPRYITFEIEIRGDPTDSDFTDLVQLARDSFSVLTGIAPFPEATLHWKWPGEVEKFVRCRPTRRYEPRDSRTEYGLVKMSVELKAADPRHYGWGQNSENMGTTMANAGNSLAYPTITITPASNAITFAHDLSTDVFSASGMSGTGDLICNFEALMRNINTLYIHRGSNDNYPEWDHPRQIFGLWPGDNEITASVGSAGVVQWYDTWLP